MTDEFEQRAREAADAYDDRITARSDEGYTDEMSFIAGAKWARAEMQAEIDHANGIATMMRKAMENEGYPKLCEDAIARIDQAETEIERLKEESDLQMDRADELAIENKQVKRELAEVNKLFLDEEELMHKWQKKADDLKAELEQAKATFKDANGMAAREILQLIEEKERANMRHAHAQDEADALKLLAESYKAILAGLIDSSDRGDTGSDSSYASYWAEARQALEDGK